MTAVVSRFLTSVALAASLAVAVIVGPQRLTSLYASPQPPAPAPQTPQGTPPAQSGQQPPKPVFRTGAELVRVDVAVIDRKGIPVSSLTAADFTLEEDGEPQEISSFQYLETTGQKLEDDDVSLTIRSRSHAAAEASKDGVRLFLIFWDEYHIGQMITAPRARSHVMQFVRSAFGPTDIVGFMDPLTPIDAIRFTRDRLELLEQARRLVGRSGVYVPTRSAVEDAHLQRGDVERLRSEVTMSALKSAAVHLGGMRDGRKTIILISEGLRGIQRDATQLMTDLTRSANDNNTAIYAIDPRGLTQSRFPSLWESVASETGGDYFRSNDIDQALRKVVTQSNGFYLLGYAPADRRMDGRFHKIKVRVKPSGLEVRARSGYWAPSIAEVERAKVKAAEAEMPVDVARAISDLPSATARRSIDFWAGTTVEEGRPVLRMSWLPRPGLPATDPKPAAVTALIMQGETKVFEGPIDISGTRIPVPPGALKVTISVADAAGDIVDRDAKAVEIPDPAKPALWIGTPALFRTQGAREYRELDRGPNATPFPGREFVRTDRLIIRFDVHGQLAATAKVSARIASQRGQDLAELPLVARPSNEGPYEIDLPLGTLARGEFMVAITAATDTENTRVLVPIRIVR